MCLKQFKKQSKGMFLTMENRRIIPKTYFKKQCPQGLISRKKWRFYYFT